MVSIIRKAVHGQTLTIRRSLAVGVVCKEVDLDMPEAGCRSRSTLVQGTRVDGTDLATRHQIDSIRVYDVKSCCQRDVYPNPAVGLS